MGFFSNIKNKTRAQIAPVMTMAPQPMPRPSVMPRRGGGFLNKIRDQAFDKIQSGKIPARRGFLRGQYFGPPQENMGSDFRMPQMPKKRGGLSGLFRKLQEQIRNQQMQPDVMPNTPNLPNYQGGIPINAALERAIAEMGAVRKEVPMQTPTMGMLAQYPENMRNLQIPTEMPVMPDERMAPPVMNQMQGDPRMMRQYGGEIRPGFVAGGPLVGRAANLANQVLSKGRMGRDLPGRATSNMGDMVMSGRAASPLTDRFRRGTEDFIMGATAGGTLGAAAIGMDGTQMFREPFSKDNVSFMSPEAFGKDMAQLRMDVGAVVNLAKNKASEMGEDINEYVSRARSAYDQQMNQDMENQRMQEIDAQQGMQPFSVLTGPNMPLRRPEPTPRQQEMQNIDDILSDLEKKN